MRKAAAPLSLAALISMTSLVSAQMFDIDSVGIPLDLSLPAAALSTYSDSHAQLRADAIIDLDDTSALLGKGFDVFKGEILPQHPCIVADQGSPDGPPASKGDPVVESDYFFNEIVTGERSLSNSSKSDVSFGLTYKLISVGFKDTASNSSNFNATDAFGRFYRQFQMLRQYRDGGQWSDRAKTLLAERKIADFLTLCGTHYVRSVIYGHRAEQMFHFALQESSYSSENSASLSVGVAKLINLGIGDDQKSTSISNISQVSHSDINNKGVPVILKVDNSVDGVKQIYNYMTYDYPKAVADSKSIGTVLSVEIRPYKDLLLPYLGRVPDWPVTIADYLQTKTALVQDFATQVSNLRYAAKLTEANYKKLYDGEYSDVDKKLNAAEATRVKFKAAVDTCEVLLRQDTLTDRSKIDACRKGLDSALSKDDITAATLAAAPIKPKS